MPQELIVHAVHQGGMHFKATTGDHCVGIDYPLVTGEEVAGPTPLQLLLMSLASCTGSAVSLLLTRMGQSFDHLEVRACGQRRDQHPTVLTEIDLEFVFMGNGINAELVEKAIRTADSKLCPVWEMLKPGTEITTKYRLVEGE
jgi:putative redox protein